MNGALLAVGLHAFVWASVFVLRHYYPPETRDLAVLVIFVGVLQLAYLGPAALIFGLLGRTHTLAGIGMVAGVTFLFNVACFPFFVGGVGPL